MKLVSSLFQRKSFNDRILFSEYRLVLQPCAFHRNMYHPFGLFPATPKPDQMGGTEPSGELQLAGVYGLGGRMCPHNRRSFNAAASDASCRPDLSRGHSSGDMEPHLARSPSPGQPHIAALCCRDAGTNTGRGFSGSGSYCGPLRWLPGKRTPFSPDKQIFLDWLIWGHCTPVVVD